MHREPDAQQSDAVVHLSYSAEQEGAALEQLPLPPSADWQYPPQHWSPDAQLAPSAWHGSSAQ
jgi:hypothetical protein